MTWVRLDDGFRDHPKVLAAGPLAGWLYVCALCYCSEHGTDGFIPKPVVPRLADIKGSEKLAERLVEVGLWEKKTGGFQVHDYLEFQPSAEQVKNHRKANNERIAKWREKRPRNGVTDVHSNRGVTPLHRDDVTPHVTGGVTPPPSTSTSTSTKEIPERPPERSSTLAFEIREHYALFVEEIIAEPYRLGRFADRDIPDLLGFFRDEPAKVRHWLRETLREFLAATREDAIARGDRGPGALARWLRSGRPTGNARASRQQASEAPHYEEIEHR